MYVNSEEVKEKVQLWSVLTVITTLLKNRNLMIIFSLISSKWKKKVLSKTEITLGKHLKEEELTAVVEVKEVKECNKMSKWKLISTPY